MGDLFIRWIFEKVWEGNRRILIIVKTHVVSSNRVLLFLSPKDEAKLKRCHAEKTI